MTPTLKDILEDFINEIPAVKLENLPKQAHWLYKDVNFHFNMQEMSVFSIGEFLKGKIITIW